MSEQDPAGEPASVVTPEEFATSLERDPKRAEPDAPDGQFDSQDMPTTDGEPAE